MLGVDGECDIILGNQYEGLV